MWKAQVKRTYYPNQQLRWEGYFERGRPVGSNREWNEKGVLIRECFFDDHGLQHGPARQWAKDGKLLGEYHMDHGTGVIKQWSETGALTGEITVIRGQFCGRLRCLLESGKTLAQEFYIRGKKVTKKKYDEACQNDPALPRYKDDEGKTQVRLPSTKYRKRKTAISENERKLHDDLIAKFRSQPNQAEARKWLADDEECNIGELMPEESREMIEEGYRAGAVKIVAVGLQDQSTNYLIVELPAKDVKRRRIFEWSNRLAQDSGFDPDDDWGQSELFVFFD